VRRADPSYRGVLPTVVCVSVWSKENKQPRHLLCVGRRGEDCEYIWDAIMTLILTIAWRD
jgi:hypothetical protein